LCISHTKNKQLFILSASQELCLAQLLLLWCRKVKDKSDQTLPKKDSQRPNQSNPLHHHRQLTIIDLLFNTNPCNFNIIFYHYYLIIFIIINTIFILYKCGRQKKGRVVFFCRGVGRKNPYALVVMPIHYSTTMMIHYSTNIIIWIFFWRNNHLDYV